MDHKIKVSEVFSRTPGPGMIKEGNYSGQLFREKVLRRLVLKYMYTDDRVIVDLDNTAGYGVSFLKNAFGGLISIDGFEVDEMLRLLKIVSEEEEYLKDDIIGYIKEGSV